MAHPEHDAALGRLAAARLHAAGAGVRLDAHPDAETWAAYADGGLVADETAVLDAHLAACAACRRIVAALAPEPAIAAPAVDVAQEPGPARVLPFRPRTMWVSMSIAAGLLAAVTVWSVTRLQQPHMASTIAERTAPSTGAGTPATAPPPDPNTAPPAADAARPVESAREVGAPLRGAAAPARTDEIDLTKRSVGLDKSVASGDDARDLALAEARLKASTAIPAAPKPEAAGGAAAANEQVAAVTQAQALPAAPARAPATPGVHGPAVNTQQQNAQALNAQMQARAQEAAQSATRAEEKERAAAPVAPAEPPRAAAARPQPAPADQPAFRAAPPPDPQAVGQVSEIVSTPPTDAARSGARRQGFGEAKRDVAASRGREGTLADADALAPAITFGEPGGRLRWRIAGGARIDSSSDAGVTWNERYTATSRLRAGSAPGIDTAWAVGEGGLVLRFAVPGTWTPVSRPTTATLVGIAASSADAARVTAEDGRVFETADGGRSWTPVEGAGAPPR